MSHNYKFKEMPPNGDVVFIIPIELPYLNSSRKNGYVALDRLGRRCIRMVNPNTQKFISTTYARYMYQVHLYKTRNGYIIPPHIEVDHINNDKLDDRLDNFQLLTKEENREKENAVRGYALNVYTCPVCGMLFSKIPYEINSSGRLTFCSTQCDHDFRFSKIPTDIMRWIADNQLLYIGRMYKRYRDEQFSHYEISERFIPHMLNHTIHDLQDVCPLDCSTMSIDTWANRRDAIRKGLVNGQGVCAIARSIKRSHANVIDFIAKYPKEFDDIM